MADAVRDVVLITRPEPEASTTSSMAAARGYTPILAPSLVYRRLARLAADDLSDVQGAVLTSAAAARAVAEDLGRPPEGLIAYCVGAKTAEAAKAAGFRRIEVAAGDAEALFLRLRRLDPEAGRLVVLRGREIAFPLAAKLSEAGFAVDERALYAADAAASLPDAAVDAIDDGRVLAALFLSARTTSAFLGLVDGCARTPRLAGVVALCNSSRTAAPAIAARVFGEVRIANEPTLAATMALAPPRV